MDWLSILVVAVIGFVTWRAFSNGFVRELVSLCAVILAIPLAGIFYDDMYPKVTPIISNDTLAALVAFLSIVAGVVILGQVAAHLIKQLVAVLNLGGADQVAGGLFGFVKAVIIIQVILIALVHFPRPDVRNAIDESPVATRLLDFAPLPLAILPGDFDTALDQFLHGVMPVVGADPTPTPESEVEAGGE